MKKNAFFSKIKSLLIDCCIITTGIIACVCLVSAFGLRAAEISVGNLAFIFLLAFITALLTLLFSFINPKSTGGDVALHVLRFCAITAVVFGFSLLDNWSLFEQPLVLILTVLSIVVIYGLVWVLNHWRDKQIAADINDQLRRYKETKNKCTESDKR